MRRVLNRLALVTACILLAIAPPAHAGALCSWFGVACGTGTSEPELSDKIDQNNPPEVFSFTVSGKFDEWADLTPRTFVCDTRKREDRACVWQGYIPEIKRNAVLSFKPFPHDRGMYKVRGIIANKFGKDTSFAGSISAPNGDYIMDEMSITNLSQNPFIIEYYGRDYMGNIDFKKKHGHLSVAFKEVLK
ncbi:hypothetical protein [Magnetovibrio sp.]|uniref:hypothetical protein n=1 Tax=Magnetovibrio sp. TaxID=2024836 RepID=UPI002F95B56F